MKLNRIMIAAPKSGSGKTMVTCAFLQALKDRGVAVCSYKCGPDYIDPMFHQNVIHVPAKNLDTFFTGEEETKRLLLHGRMDGEFAVLEGVMGLFDGLGGVREEGSSYHLAKVTKTPVILVVDAKGMGRSLIPLLSGFLAYDQAHLIQGVILNRMSKGYHDILKPFIEKELKLCVLGYIPENRELCVESRHLGLKMPGELQDLKKKVQTAAAELEKTVEVEKIIEIGENARSLALAEDILLTKDGYRKEVSRKSEEGDDQAAKRQEKLIIAVAKDEAFCFYYEDNLRLLGEYGAEIRYFSPLSDQSLPDGCCGLLLGGGYPELFAERLSENKAMLTAVRNAIEQGMPSVAECGGFLYLHTHLTDGAGKHHTMAGVLPGCCYDTGKLVRFGYIEISEKQSSFLSAGGRIRGHEFHYYDSTENGEDCQAVKPVTGKNYSCIVQGERYWWGFPHLYYPSNPEFAKNFVEKARKYRDRRY